MTRHPVGIDDPGLVVLLMGNEAIARGAIEANVRVASAYPGTPSSEIGNTLSRIANDLNFHFEWSSNEKVAFEVAYGASMCGLRSLVAMKHVGLNVAADILNPVSLRGVAGGLVVAVADDPSKHSSRTEQDSRWLAKLNGVPVIEPSTPQEAKDYTIYAYELSERLKTPVMLRMVTRLSHMRSNVTLGRMITEQKRGEFNFDSFSRRFGSINLEAHRERNKKLIKIKQKFETLIFNELKMDGDEEFGMIGSGFAFSYIFDAIQKLGLTNEIAYLKLATPYPLPEKMIGKFIGGVQNILIAEEVDPFVELHVKAIAKDVSPDLIIHGRMSGNLPMEGELSTILIVEALSSIVGIESPFGSREVLENKIEESLFTRMRTMCAGCPHRATSYALKKAVQKVEGDLKKVVINGDIGCYSLVSAPPISFVDTAECMGASIGVSQGMIHSDVETIPIALIGDGTFFHSGIPGLINAVYNQANIKVVVADNQTTAMTGFQPNPTSGKDAMGKPTKRILIEDIARACGVEYIKVVDPNDLDATENAFVEMLETDGPAMIISRRLCATEELRLLRPQRPVPYMVDANLCIGCQLCMYTFGCPAFIWNKKKGKMQIDTILCMGCGVCSQICPHGAIGLKEEN